MGMSRSITYAVHFGNRGEFHQVGPITFLDNICVGYCDEVVDLSQSFSCVCVMKCLYILAACPVNCIMHTCHMCCDYKATETLIIEKLSMSCEKIPISVCKP